MSTPVALIIVFIAALALAAFLVGSGRPRRFRDADVDGEPDETIAEKSRARDEEAP